MAASDTSTRVHPGAILATTAIFILCALAALPAVQATDADRITLLALAMMSVIAFWTPLCKYFEAHSEAAAFALTAVMFIVYGLARQAGTLLEFSLPLGVLPDDHFKFSWAALLNLLAVAFSAPLWWRTVRGWVRAFLLSALLLAFLAGFSVWLLARFYPVGATEIVDPKPTVNTLLQLIEYSALALLCHAATIETRTRALLLRALPLILWLLWARHQFVAPPEENDE